MKESTKMGINLAIVIGSTLLTVFGIMILAFVVLEATKSTMLAIIVGAAASIIGAVIMWVVAHFLTK